MGIRNFKPELNSGVVVIRTIYDNVILDESGTSETNRKASFGVSASLLNYSDLTFYPKTEGTQAIYHFTLRPKIKFDYTAII